MAATQADFTNLITAINTLVQALPNQNANIVTAVNNVARLS